MFDSYDWLVLGNTALQWAVAASVFVATVVVGRVAIRIALVRLESLALRTHTELDDLLAELLKKTKLVSVLLIALWAAARSLTLDDRVERGISSLLTIGFLVQVAFWGSGVVSHLVDRYRLRQVEVDPGGATAVGAMAFLGRVLVWTVTVLLVLDNIGIDVTALITGLGIGGIAVALALQNVLSDLFASLSIVLDKPFVVGDFVVVGDVMGTVEHVGLKTTRLRSLSGEQVVVSNSDLLSSRIRNFKRMAERRAVLHLGIVYETPIATVRAVPAMIREAVEARENTRFDRAHFRSYGASSLDFEAVYHVLSPDYNTYMDIQQAINLDLFERFAAAKIEFAYPTQTVYAHVADPARERQGGSPVAA